MQAMLDKYVPGYYDKPLERSHLERYTSSLGSKTAIYKLPAEFMSAKEKDAIPEQMYFAGRTAQSDREQK